MLAASFVIIKCVSQCVYYRVFRNSIYLITLSFFLYCIIYSFVTCPFSLYSVAQSSPMDYYNNNLFRVSDPHRLAVSFDAAVLSSLLESCEDIGQLYTLLRSGIYSNGGYFIRFNQYKIRIPIEITPILAESVGLVFPDRLLGTGDKLLRSMVMEAFTGMSLSDSYKYQTLDILTDQFPSTITKQKSYGIGYADKRYFIGSNSFKFDLLKLKRLVKGSAEMKGNVVFNSDGSITLKGILKDRLDERIHFLEASGCRQFIASSLFYDLLAPEERYYLDLVLKKGIYHNRINSSNLSNLLYKFDPDSGNNELLNLYINDVVGFCDYNNSSYAITSNTRYIKYISGIDDRYLMHKAAIYHDLGLPSDFNGLSKSELVELASKVTKYNHAIKSNTITLPSILVLIFLCFLVSFEA